MTLTPKLTEAILFSFLACPYKAHLKLRCALCEESDYIRLQARTATEYRNAARKLMLEIRPEAVAAQDPPSLADAIRGGADLIFDANISDGDESCRLDAVERIAEGKDDTVRAYVPVVFTQHERVMPEDRLRLAFGASLLARVTGTQPARGRIVFGPRFQTTRVSLPVLEVRLNAVVGQIRDLQHTDQPPPMLLNRHCPECEFRSFCRAAAIERDDLRLLRGLSPRTIAALNRRGIFTVTQYSHTFRPGRMKRALKGLYGKHDFSLQALAIREKKIYVARRPDLPAARVSAYLDVEGVPDRAFYYLIGLSWDDGMGLRRSSYWADREADEGTIWAAFLRAFGELGDDFTMFHYGSYELQFLKRMEERYGGDLEVMARLKAKCVNVLSAIHTQVYFPVYANDLKSVAGCLGSHWSAPDASGLQSIVWRAEWAARGTEVIKQRLLDYNREDCEALERVVHVLRGLASTVASGGDGSCPTIAGVEDIKAPRRHKFCDPQFVLPEFAQISKCAYFDYQRDRVLFRTSPAVKRANRRKIRPRQATRKVNRKVECLQPACCPHCLSTDINGLDRNTRLVVDLKPTRGGLRQWTTRYSAKRFHCSKCDQVFLPDEFLAIRTHRYGWTLCGWVAYACVALRQTSRATTDALDDMFGIHFQSGMVTNLREQAAKRYRGTYEALLRAYPRTLAVRKATMVN
jgi:predicted RecB family nuclease